MHLPRQPQETVNSGQRHFRVSPRNSPRYSLIPALGNMKSIFPWGFKAFSRLSPLDPCSRSSPYGPLIYRGRQERQAKLRSARCFQPPHRTVATPTSIPLGSLTMIGFLIISVPFSLPDDPVPFVPFPPFGVALPLLMKGIPSKYLPRSRIGSVTVA